MNNFYPSAQIHSISNKNYDKFYEQSILFNAKIFSKIDPKKLVKIIYSSSSAVYNSIRKIISLLTQIIKFIPQQKLPLKI